MHLTNDKLRHLATLVTEDLPFSSDDVSLMQHIGECEDCYRKLKRYMALFEAIVSEETETEHPFSSPKEEQSGPDAAAVVSIVFVDTKALFKQLNAEKAAWKFDAALSGIGQRATGGNTQYEYRYEDIKNSETYISYNEKKKELTVQIDGSTLDAPPIVLLRFSSGRELELKMERYGSSFVGVLNDLSGESLNVIIKKQAALPG